MDEPTPPDVAEYVIDGLQARSAGELRALADYCRRLADYKERSIDPDDVDDDRGTVIETTDAETALADEALEDLEDLDLEGIEQATGGTVVIKKVPCGKDCSGCPHGPYAYLNWRDGSGTVRTKYLRSVERE